MADPIDAPIKDPHDDLLAMSADARRLARRLADAPLPFTLGIYGAWGEGKTTFANLLAYYLERQPGWEEQRYIQFTAWPYVTADAVWRALLETVGREVYDVPLDSALTEPATPLRTRLFNRLNREVFPGTTEPDEDRRDRDDFEKLMSTLGKTTTVANRAAADAESARQLSTLAKMVVDVAAVSSASPLGALRGLLGGAPPEVKAADRTLTDVEEMRHVVRALFRRASSPRTVVLIDDLDRCLPEVAFDVLETIKIFLSESEKAEANCLFVVAVDQVVLNRGLTARIGGDPATQQMDGRMYLEKVIQLGISVAGVREASADRFIAAQFPEWVGAADLIDIATRGNPRRLKQQCDLLAFGFAGVEVADDDRT